MSSNFTDIYFLYLLCKCLRIKSMFAFNLHSLSLSLLSLSLPSLSLSLSCLSLHLPCGEKIHVSHCIWEINDPELDFCEMCSDCVCVDVCAGGSGVVCGWGCGGRVL